jgi:hypothetical protein
MPPLSEIEEEQIEQLKEDIYELLDRWGVDTSESKLEGLIDKIANKSVISLMNIRRYDKETEETMNLFDNMDIFLDETEKESSDE